METLDGAGQLRTADLACRSTPRARLTASSSRTWPGSAARSCAREPGGARRVDQSPVCLRHLARAAEVGEAAARVLHRRVRRFRLSRAEAAARDRHQRRPVRHQDAAVQSAAVQSPVVAAPGDPSRPCSRSVLRPAERATENWHARWRQRASRCRSSTCSQRVGTALADTTGASVDPGALRHLVLGPRPYAGPCDPAEEPVDQRRHHLPRGVQVAQAVREGHQLLRRFLYDARRLLNYTHFTGWSRRAPVPP